MMKKYKIHEFSKDLNVSSKDVVAILQEHYDEPKKSTTALSEEELDLIFDYFTQKTAVSDFNAYFASAHKNEESAAEEPKKEEKAAKGAKTNKAEKIEKNDKKPSKTAKDAKETKSADKNKNNAKRDTKSQKSTGDDKPVESVEMGIEESVL